MEILVVAALLLSGLLLLILGATGRAKSERDLRALVWLRQTPAVTIARARGVVRLSVRVRQLAPLVVEDHSGAAEVETAGLVCLRDGLRVADRSLTVGEPLELRGVVRQVGEPDGVYRSFQAASTPFVVEGPGVLVAAGASDAAVTDRRLGRSSLRILSVTLGSLLLAGGIAFGVAICSVR